MKDAAERSNLWGMWGRGGSRSQKATSGHHHCFVCSPAAGLEQTTAFLCASVCVHAKGPRHTPAFGCSQLAERRRDRQLRHLQADKVQPHQRARAADAMAFGFWRRKHLLLSSRNGSADGGLTRWESGMSDSRRSPATSRV